MADRLDEYVELTGRTIRYPKPDRATRAFLKRVRQLVDDPKVGPKVVRALVFGPDNPILARHPILGGGYPDAQTVRNPLYWVCVDLVLRAEAHAGGISPEAASRPFTMSVADAATRLGRYTYAVQNAINNRTLHAWVRNGRTYLLPAEVAAYDVPRRGRPPKKKRKQ